MLEYRSLSSVIRQVINEQATKQSLEDKGNTEVRQIDNLGFVYKRPTGRWAYIRMNSVRPSTTLFTSEKQAETELRKVAGPKRPSKEKNKENQQGGQENPPADNIGKQPNFYGSQSIPVAKSQSSEVEPEDKSQSSEVEPKVKDQSDKGKSDKPKVKDQSDKGKSDKPKVKKQSDKGKSDKPKVKDQSDKGKSDKPKVKKNPNRRIVSGKDKTLNFIETADTAIWGKDLSVSDKDFYDKVKGDDLHIKGVENFKFSEELRQTNVVSQRHWTLLERLINTKLENSVSSKFTYFTGDFKPGDGTNASRAGEIATLIGASLPEKMSKKFFNVLVDHARAQTRVGEQAILTEDWIQAASGNVNAIHRYLKKEHGKFEIVNGAWDTKEEVEALGLEDYDNKGFSTDVYFKVKVGDNEEHILHEVSLKKTTRTNLFNKSAAIFKDWDDQLDSDIDVSVYFKSQRNRLINFFGDPDILENVKSSFTKPEIEELKSISELSQIPASKARTLYKAIEKIQNEHGKFDWGKKASKFIKELKGHHDTFVENALNAISKNEKLKNGMLNEISREFPLKAVSEREEQMALGDFSLDPHVMEHVFGTNDYVEIKENLITVEGKPPYLAYFAHAKGDIIPIANIEIREGKGVGYGGEMKFDMKIHTEFANKLEKANEKIYGI